MLQIIVTKRRLEFEISQLWAKIKNTFARISHTHSISDVSELSLVLNEIRALIQPAPEKEVVNVLSAGDTMPEDPSEGDRWIDIENNLLYSYSEDDGWGEDNPDEDSVYITSDTSHIYLWNGSEFVDSTGQPVDNTLYVHNTTTELEQYTDRGMYNVCVGGNSWYTMVVSSYRRTLFGRPPRVRVTYRQLLCNNDGWYVRTKVNNGEWSEWEDHEYSYKGHKHVLADIADVAIVPDEEASEVIPIESATLQSIARGTYKQADTAMFSGHPDYIPLTAEEVTALVGTAMDAFRAAQEIHEENE
ncbi:MAG: hypothetical protein IJQ18_08645 [Paludibacteraceae bacterium]|nr:hypothetical protein [Paludibacteraceae bacterium]